MELHFLRASLLVFIILELAVSGWLGSRQYRRRLSINLRKSSSPTHLEESFSLNTYDLSLSEKLGPNCTSVAFFLTNSLTRASTTLSWWSETACPGSAADDPYTIFWVSVPSPSTTVGSIYLVYGKSDDDDENVGRILSGPGLPIREVRLISGSSPTCPPLTTPNHPSAWDGIFMAASASISSSSAPPPLTIITPPTHTHSVKPSSFHLANAADSGLPLTSPQSACVATGTGDVSVMGPEHTHASVSGTDYVTGPSGAILPASLLVRACNLDLDENINYRVGYPVDVGTFPVVMLFLENPEEEEETEVAEAASLMWEVISGSEDGGMFIRFDDAGPVRMSGGAATSTGHSHSSTNYLGDFDFGDDAGGEVLVEGGAHNFLAETHSHGSALTSIQLSSAAGTDEHLFVPEHSRVHVRVQKSGSPRIVMGDNSMGPDWDLGYAMRNAIYIFESAVPPLGFVPVSPVNNSVLRLFPSDSTDSAFDILYPPGNHTHRTSNIYSASSGTLTQFELGEDDAACTVGVFGPVARDNEAHQHWISGVTEPNPEVDALRRITLVLAHRMKPERPILGLGAEEDWAKRYDAVYAGIGSAFGVVAGLVIVVVGVGAVVGLVFFFLRRRRKKRSDLFGDETQLGDDFTTGKGVEANLEFDATLFEIRYGDIKIGRKIASGGSSAVIFRAKWASKNVAFKCFRLEDFYGKEAQFEAFEREVKVLGSLSHPSILRFFGATIKPPRVGIVMEYCSNGDLRTYVETSGCEHSVRLRLLNETANAMLFLHQRKVIHRDLKPENVLVSESVEARVCDFGLARIIHDISVDKTRAIGTSYYMAPELFTEDYDFKIDVFAFGIMMYVVLGGNFRPYGDTMHPELKVAHSPSFRPDVASLSLPENFSMCVELMEKCWRHEPSARPSFREIVLDLDENAALLWQKLDDDK